VLVKGYNNTITREEFVKKIILSNLPVIVEGKKDVAKLKKLGVHSVIQLSQKPLCSFAENIAQDYIEVILLMDNDKEGKKLYSKLKTEFKHHGINVNEEFQEDLKKLKVSHVEGL